MDLLLLTPHFAPDFEGGTEFVARAQGRALLRRGHRVRVVSGTERPLGQAPAVPQGVDGMTVTYLARTPAETYDLALQRPRLMEELESAAAGCQLAHLHHWSTLGSDTVRRLAARMPVVVSLHDLFATCPRFFRVPVEPVTSCPAPGEGVQACARCLQVDSGGLALDVLEQQLAARAAWLEAELRAAACVLVPSRTHLERLTAHLPFLAPRARVLPHGLCADPGPWERTAGGAARATALPWDGHGPLRVLFIGHRTPLKGVGDLVQALAGLPAESRARVELCLLGQEVQAGFDAELARAAGDLTVRFAGPYRVEELVQRVAAAGGAHLAALPSRVEESYGLVLDEAQALGLPAWVSDRGAPRERVGSAGRVLPAEDPVAWRRAFAEVLQRPEILETERRALPASVRTAHDAAAELEALYTELLQPES